MPFYSRKPTRIPDYDYSASNYYFITICTHNRKCIFGEPDQLNRYGKIVLHHINQIPHHYHGVYIDKYVVMPNHVHMILVLDKSKERNDASQVIGQFKSGVTRQIRITNPNAEIWQRSFHDHIIRNQESYEKIWLYIEGNPQCWEKDCFFEEHTTETVQNKKV